MADDYRASRSWMCAEDSGDRVAGDTGDTGAHWEEDIGEHGIWTPRSRSGRTKVS
ncbi:hypothetical protein [Paenibacillus xylanexedens]|uniref:hypothetical protein n=1 Tax=Paenibacillus xylanexedens TaxID=528191 RepID=UPI0016439ECB|nr:hypothetical protein [Paenibacillus xylanexedens]